MYILIQEEGITVKISKQGHRIRVILFNIARILIMPFIKIKFNYSYDSLKNVKGPYLLVCNHNTDFDPVFLGLSSRKFVYMVATENVTRMGFFSKVVAYLYNPIIHYKGKMGIHTVKDMLARAKGGYNIGIFPEGNRSFNGVTSDFLPTIGKVAKKAGINLVTYRLSGGYLTQPRWSTSFRRGAVRGILVNVYSPEQLEAMTEDEVNEAIRNDIHDDAYEGERIAYKGRKTAERLETALFMCPECKSIGTLRSNGNRLRCSSCDYDAEYDDYGYLNGVSIKELDALQHEYIKNNDVAFKDKVTVDNIVEHVVVSSFEAVLEADGGLKLDGKPLECTGLEIFGRNRLIVHTPDKHYEINGDSSFSALKYKYYYEKI